MGMITAAGRRAAWDAYLAVTAGLVPALRAGPAAHGPVVNSGLGGVVVRIRRYAPLWGDDGVMLVAAVRSAVRLYRTGDRAALIDLLQHIGHRLFVLSAAHAPTGDRSNQQRHRYPFSYLDQYGEPPTWRDSEQEGSTDD